MPGFRFRSRSNNLQILWVLKFDRIGSWSQITMPGKPIEIVSQQIVGSSSGEDLAGIVNLQISGPGGGRRLSQKRGKSRFFFLPQKSKAIPGGILDRVDL